jgi:hypothetical protein
MWFRYPLNKQAQDKWCWAAVATSVDRYFDPGSALSQCEVAGEVLDRGCCPDGEKCNQVESLDKALSKFDRLDGLASASALSFTEIQQQIDNRMPVCVRVEWRGGGGHFVVITGYGFGKSGRQMLEISDPLFPKSLMWYDDFVWSYQNVEQPDGGGFWSHTFQVKK